MSSWRATLEGEDGELARSSRQPELTKEARTTHRATIASAFGSGPICVTVFGKLVQGSLYDLGERGFAAGRHVSQRPRKGACYRLKDVGACRDHGIPRRVEEAVGSGYAKEVAIARCLHLA